MLALEPANVRLIVNHFPSRFSLRPMLVEVEAWSNDSPERESIFSIAKDLLTLSMQSQAFQLARAILEKSGLFFGANGVRRTEAEVLTG